MNMTCTDVSPAVPVCDKSAIISWSTINPFSDRLPLARLGCVTCNTKCEYGSAPLAQKGLAREAGQSGIYVLSPYLAWCIRFICILPQPRG